jgi:nucleotide-binding universal stress UspA family protein
MARHVRAFTEALDVPLGAVLEGGYEPIALAECVRETLLVLGSHGRGFVGRLIMGSVCDRVVRAAACAVLVVPPEEITDVRTSTRLSPAIPSTRGS